MSLVLNVEILGEFRNLTKATQGSQSELSKLNKKITGFSKSAKSAFASIGVGLSFAFIARELGDATKAAVEDSKAQAILAKQLENTTGANKDQIASVEKSISKWQTQFGILDDQLRPAYATLIRSTGDVTSANKLMAIALDASAATGKSLEAVTLAMGKSFNGSDTALIKLMPSLKGSKDAINDLAAATAGAAKTAADTDPYMRMTAIFADLQEKVGMALLPALGKLSTWLASPGGTEALKLISDALVGILTDAIAVAKWAVKNKDWLLPLAAGIGAITTAWKVATAGVAAYNAVAAIAAGFGAAGGAKGIAGKLAPIGLGLGVAGAVGGVLSLGGSAALTGTSGASGTGNGIPSATASPQRYAAYMAGLNKSPVAASNLLTPTKTSSGITVNVTQAVTAKTIIDTVSAYQKSTGTTLAQALR
jgi:hypothetical protein